MRKYAIETRIPFPLKRVKRTVTFPNKLLRESRDASDWVCCPHYFSPGNKFFSHWKHALDKFWRSYGSTWVALPTLFTQATFTDSPVSHDNNAILNYKYTTEYHATAYNANTEINMDKQKSELPLKIWSNNRSITVTFKHYRNAVHLCAIVHTAGA